MEALGRDEWLVWLWSCLLVVGATSCATPRAPMPTAAVAEPAPLEGEPLGWAQDEEWMVVVRRSCRTLSVYRRGDWVRTYRDVAFGRNPGEKLVEGDRRTPGGLYRMVGRRHHPRWSRFILLDYPNVRDLEVHGAARASGSIDRGPGSQIGIHGSDEPILNRGGVDWTYGCISLLNEDVRELYEMVPPGTLVLIED